MIHEFSPMCRIEFVCNNLRESWLFHRAPEATRARSAGFDVARFRSDHWPKAFFHRSLGQRPRNTLSLVAFWPKAILTAAHHSEYGLRPNNLIRTPFPGVLPQATVKKGLRPKCDLKMRNFKARERGTRQTPSSSLAPCTREDSLARAF